VTLTLGKTHASFLKGGRTEKSNLYNIYISYALVQFVTVSRLALVNDVGCQGNSLNFR